MERRDYLLNLENLLGSISKIKFLKTLYRNVDVEDSISWYASNAGISVNQAKLIVDDYKSMKIINYRVVGKAILIVLKKDNIFYDMISQLFGTYFQIYETFKNDLKSNIEKSFKDVEIYIYGSIVRNDLSSESDIDVLLLFDVKISDGIKESVFNLENYFSEKYQKNISILFLKKSDYNNNYKSLKRNIDIEGVKL